MTQSNDTVEVGHAPSAICGWRYTPSNLDPCGLPTPDPPLEIWSEWARYNADSGGLAQYDGTDATHSAPSSVLVTRADGSKLRVISLESLSIPTGSLLDIYGTIPVVFAIQGSATIGGVIAYSLGPTTACPGVTDGGLGIASGGGGGGGGGYGSAGAAGGDGNGIATPLGDGGMGGSAHAGLVPLHPGCAGARGGGSIVAGGVGGVGAGAIQISARDALRIDGVLDASGGRGFGGKAGSGGGGGGGTGGALLLEATTLTIGSTAGLCANGGSGGQGGDPTTEGGDGSWGSCSETSSWPSDDRSRGGIGGAGGVATKAPEAGARGDEQSLAGGGGGGGAVGHVGLRARNGVIVPDAAVVSPAATILP